MDLQLGKRIDRPIRLRRIGRADHVRIGPERPRLDSESARRFSRADKLQRRIILIVLKVSLRKRRAAGERGILQIGGVIITTERKRPDLVDFGPAAGWGKITPRNAAFD